MVTHLWSALGTHPIIDSKTNGLTFTVVEQFQVVVEKPKQAYWKQLLLPLRGQVISLWLQDLKTPVASLEQRIRIRNAKGKEVGRATGTSQFGTAHRLRTFSDFNALPFPKNGNGYYWFFVDQKISGKWKNVSKLPLMVEVKVVESPTAPPA